MRLGEFDPPQMNPYSKLSVTDVVQSADHRELAVEVALKTFVLLKNNDSVLPLSGKVTTLADYLASLGKPNMLQAVRGQILFVRTMINKRSRWQWREQIWWWCVWGQQKFINVTITAREMAIYTDQWVVPPVGMTVFAGGQQPLQNTAIVSNVAYGTFTINGNMTPLKNCGHIGP
uniref:Uncharacterized protein n=1 Tax=Branchiostoma floridae TaxID=7739 RepID=C3ZWF3_BRAFL|eukprot:XP_002587144.1 hypothetical protein BRAFLDRAFT_129991 [Branchiostoma floridae]